MLSPPETELLFRLASQCSNGAIVEIGSWRGKSAVAMAYGVKTRPEAGRAPIYCIEPHAVYTGFYGGRFDPQDRGEFYKAMLKAECTDVVALVNLKSVDAAKAWSLPIGLLFIDGDHSKEGVAADVAAWTPFVITGGIIAFDDAADTNAGPCAAIARMLKSGGYERVGQTGKIAVLRKL